MQKRVYSSGFHFEFPNRKSAVNAGNNQNKKSTTRLETQSTKSEIQNPNSEITAERQNSIPTLQEKKSIEKKSPTTVIPIIDKQTMPSNSFGAVVYRKSAYQNPVADSTGVSPKTKKGKASANWGLILVLLGIGAVAVFGTFILTPIGYVLSIIGKHRSEKGSKYYKRAKAGTIIGLITILLDILVVILVLTYI
jgi:hypothetical protein